MLVQEKTIKRKWTITNPPELLPLILFYRSGNKLLMFPPKNSLG